MSCQRGAAALLLVLALLAAAVTMYAAAWPLAEPNRREQKSQQALAEAAQALAGYARARRCVAGSGTILSHLPCPDLGGGEGVAAATCAGPSLGRLPWRTLGLPPLRDGHGECLWYERGPLGARVIAPGPALAGQTRAAGGAAPVCGGHYAQTDYLEPAGNDRALAVDSALLGAPAGC
jgi:type II secretory pathway pseudopilin PulG